MIGKLLTAHHLEFLSLKKAAEARLSVHLSKCQIVGNSCSGSFAILPAETLHSSLVIVLGHVHL